MAIPYLVLDCSEAVATTFHRDRGRARRQHVCDITTTARHSTRNIAGTQRIEAAATVHHGRIELDSHADTTVFGKNFILFVLYR